MRVFTVVAMKTLEQQFDSRVRVFLGRTGVSPTTFGMKALGDPNLMRQLDGGRSLSLRTADRVLAFVADYDLDSGGPRTPPRGHRRRKPSSRTRRTRRSRAMTGARLTAALECANDAGGRCALWPSGDAHACYGVSHDTATSCAFAAGSVSAARAALTGTGATPPSGCLVRHRGGCSAPLRGGGSPVRQPSSRCVCASPEDRARTRGERQTVGCRERRAMSRRFGSPETLG